MKFIPRHSQAVGRTVIKKPKSNIILLNETKNTTKFVLIDAVGPGAAAAGLKVGDVIIARVINNIVMSGGALFRPMVEEKDVALFVTDLGPGDLAVQTESGEKFVPLDHEEAAQSMGAPPTESHVQPRAAE